MLHLIMELVFVITASPLPLATANEVGYDASRTASHKRSRLRCLKNGIPQVSVLAPVIFNIYISDLPAIISRKYAYANDLAIMHAHGDRKKQWKGAKQRHGNRW